MISVSRLAKLALVVGALFLSALCLAQADSQIEQVETPQERVTPAADASKSEGDSALDVWVKVFQLVFYAGAVGFYVATVYLASKTYGKASHGLLNQVNTEYQKRALDRLAEVSRELFDCVDREIAMRSAADLGLGDVAERLSEMLESNRQSLIASDGHFFFDMPERARKVGRLAVLYESDPFIPRKLRTPIVAFLEMWAEQLKRSYYQTIRKYAKEAAENYEGRFNVSMGVMDLKQRLDSSFEADGIGYTVIYDKVAELRNAIQLHYEEFDVASPHKGRTGR